MKSALFPLVLLIFYVATAPPTLASAAQCKGAFERSDMWLVSFVHQRCTDRGWSIARRASGTRLHCAALHPGGEMILVFNRQRIQNVMLRNLQDDRWLATADQFADVRVAIDGLPLFEGLMEVEVAAPSAQSRRRRGL